MRFILLPRATALQMKAARFHRPIVDSATVHIPHLPTLAAAVAQTEPLSENQMENQRKLTRLRLADNQAESDARRHTLRRRNAVRHPLLHRLVVGVLLVRPLRAHQGGDNDNASTL